MNENTIPLEVNTWSIGLTLGVVSGLLGFLSCAYKIGFSRINPGLQGGEHVTVIETPSRTEAKKTAPVVENRPKLYPQIPMMPWQMWMPPFQVPTQLAKQIALSFQTTNETNMSGLDAPRAPIHKSTNSFSTYDKVTPSN